MTQLIYDNDKETETETKEFHLKQLYEKSLKSIGKKPQLDKLSFEQQVWIKRKKWRTKQ